MKKNLRILPALLALALILSLLPASLADAPAVLAQPEDTHVLENGLCEFSALGTEGVTYSWTLRDPATGSEYLQDGAASAAEGLELLGYDTPRLILVHVPASMSGWEAQCVMITPDGKMMLKTRWAKLTVVGAEENTAPAETEAPETEGETPAVMNINDLTSQRGGTETPAPRTEDGVITVKAFGAAYLQELKKNSGTGSKMKEMTFEGDTADLFIGTNTGGKRVAYWVINGVRYDFNHRVGKIALTDLTWDMTIEAVLKGDDAETIGTVPSGGQPQVITSIKSKMCFLNGEEKPYGTQFTEFDFSGDYTNLATGRPEKGGRITFYTKATIPSGKKVSAWKFNEAKFKFGADITSFYVTEQNSGFTYEPLFSNVTSYTTDVPGYIPPVRPAR